MDQVDICNLALGRIGQGASSPIQSITEDSEAARACNRSFAHAMSTALREYRWSWAQASVALALTTQEVPGFVYCYAYPSGCLFLHGLADACSDPGRHQALRWPYRIVAATDGQSRVIATDLPGAWAHYTREIANPAFGDPLFQDALAWRLAKELALGLRAQPQFATLAEQEYQLALSKATAANENEQGADRAPEPEDVRAYTGGALHADPWRTNEAPL